MDLLAITAGVGVFVITVQFFFIMFKRNKGDDLDPITKKLSFEDMDINKDMYIVNYIISFVTNEYVENNIKNNDTSMKGDKRTKIPISSTQHQKHVDKITSLVMEVCSDHFLDYLSKYFDRDSSEYIIKIYVKKIYKSLIDDLLTRRINNMKEKHNKIKSLNEKNNNQLPQEIKNIINKHDVSIEEAKNEVSGFEINKEKYDKLKDNSPDKELADDYRALKNFFTDNQ